MQIIWISLLFSMLYYFLFLYVYSSSETNRPPIKVPSGIMDCPMELARTPEAWAKSHYQDLIQYTTAKKCGHFAAFEEPAVMATDIRNFIHKVESGFKP